MLRLASLLADTDAFSFKQVENDPSVANADVLYFQLVVNIQPTTNRRTIRKVFDGVLVANNRYDEKEDFGEGDLGKSYDAIAFGRAFLANPDLPAR